MNRNEFAPDNNSAGKLNESKIIGGFLFKTDQEFTKAIEKRVRDLSATPKCLKDAGQHDPAPLLKSWI